MMDNYVKFAARYNKSRDPVGLLQTLRLRRRLRPALQKVNLESTCWMFVERAEKTVHAAADLQDEDDAAGQPAHLEATRRTQADSPPVFAAGVPQQAQAAPRQRVHGRRRRVGRRRRGQRPRRALQRHRRRDGAVAVAGGVGQQRRGSVRLRRGERCRRTNAVGFVQTAAQEQARELDRRHRRHQQYSSVVR